MSNQKNIFTKLYINKALNNLATGAFGSLSDSKQIILVSLIPNTATLNALALVPNLASAATSANIGLSDVLATQAYVTTAVNNATSNFASTINSALGGSGTTISRVNSIDSELLITPTGVVSTDLTTARSLLVPSLGATLQTDVQTLNSLNSGENSIHNC